MYSGLHHKRHGVTSNRDHSCHFFINNTQYNVTKFWLCLHNILMFDEGLFFFANYIIPAAYECITMINDLQKIGIKMLKCCVGTAKILLHYITYYL